MGTGDWNDGMNRVGEKGLGESVWLAWFLYDALLRFAPVCEAREDGHVAARLRGRAERLQRAAEESAWDGDWYLRAWYDDGAPLGSKESDECQIDLLVQAWSVLSGAADPERAGRALESAWTRLVSPREHLARLLAPAFDQTSHDPGYIKGYPPGIRENGGQYSHAAVWGAWAFTRRGDGDRAVEILRAIDPLYRTRTPDGVALYRVEPYVVPADVYGVPPHTGRGGWTWYTGTAGWTWRLIVEAILGVRRRATPRGEAVLEIEPCLPRDWPEATVEVRFGAALYRIRIDNPERAGHGVAAISLDGRPLREPLVPLEDDGKPHEVFVRLGAPPAPDGEEDARAREGEVLRS
jgi:cellobiose phosphorylase